MSEERTEKELFAVFIGRSLFAAGRLGNPDNVQTELEHMGYAFSGGRWIPLHPGHRELAERQIVARAQAEAAGEIAPPAPPAPPASPKPKYKKIALTPGELGDMPLDPFEDAEPEYIPAPVPDSTQVKLLQGRRTLEKLNVIPPDNVDVMEQVLEARGYEWWPEKKIWRVKPDVISYD